MGYVPVRLEHARGCVNGKSSKQTGIEDFLQQVDSGLSQFFCLRLQSVCGQRPGMDVQRVGAEQTYAGPGIIVVSGSDCGCPATIPQFRVFARKQAEFPKLCLKIPVCGDDA